MSKTGLLEAQTVSLVRGGRVILEQISLRLRPGAVTVLLGPNGAGKSSLLALLGGLLQPDAGHVALDDQELARWPLRALARRRAMLSQQVTLEFPCRVEEVVRLGLSPYHGSSTVQAQAERIEGALRWTGVTALRERLYPSLSGGEQRRVQLARVLAQLSPTPQQPGWLLLDEPEANLDIAHQHSLLRQIRAQAQRDCGVLMTLHDIHLAARYADRVLLLAGGRLCHDGPPAEVLRAESLSALYGLELQRFYCAGQVWFAPARSAHP